MIRRIEIHPRLVEETVWRAVRGREESAAFHREREPVYRLEDPEARERAFARLHGDWFRRLAIDAPINQATGEHGDLMAAVSRCLFAPALTRRFQGAELFVNSSGARSVVVTILPELLTEPDRALEFFRRELMHIDDILDPGFRYEPSLPQHPAGPAHDRVLQTRYRALWNCSVDGRLVKLGRVTEGARAFRLSEFGRAFACLGPGIEDCFEGIFSGARPDHPTMVDMASHPETRFGRPGNPAASARRCPLCAFPTVDFEPAPGAIPPSVLATIRSEFPVWRVEDGLCRQCADLYRTRRLSEHEAALIPGLARP